MSKQHCQSNIVEATGNFVTCCFDIVAKNGNNVEATFDIVAFDNVASTLLLVWTGLYSGKLKLGIRPDHLRPRIEIKFCMGVVLGK